MNIECDRSFTRSDALAKHMRTVHEPEPPKASLTNANPIDPLTGQPKKGPKLRIINGSVKKDALATVAEKNPANAGLDISDPNYDPSPPNDNIVYTPAHHPVTGQPGFMINYPPDIQFSSFESEIPSDQLMRLLRRQIYWAQREHDKVKDQCDVLEAQRNDEWLKKEILVDALLEAEFEVGTYNRTMTEEETKSIVKDVRTRNLDWTREPWWKGVGKSVVADDDYADDDVNDYPDDYAEDAGNLE